MGDIEYERIAGPWLRGEEPSLSLSDIGITMLQAHRISIEM
jgi:hypothetical protein